MTARDTTPARVFTLAEALLSLVLLALLAITAQGMYSSAFQTTVVTAQDALLDSALRSRTEWLMAVTPSQLASGSDTVTVGGTSYPISWTVVNVDLDGDATPDPVAKRLTVTLQGKSLTTIVVDHEGHIGKL